LEFLGEVVLNFLGEMLAELGFKSVQNQGDGSPKVVVGIGLVVLGAVAGVVTVLALPRPVTPPLPVRGLSLLVSPLVMGLLMDRYGNWRQERTGKRTYIATLWGGALFAFGMAAMRFVLLR
jgi:hypothetical protein